MSWRRVFQRKQTDADLKQEMEHYLSEEIDENIARGMSAAEARRQAHVKLGNRQ